MIVLDTNVVSEQFRATGDLGVIEWADQLPREQTFLTATTVSEISLGIALLPSGKRRAELANWARGVFGEFFDFTLPFDAESAVLYGRIVAEARRAGTQMQRADAEIAAICMLHGAQLATRNVKDFDQTGIELINPFEPS